MNPDWDQRWLKMARLVGMEFSKDPSSQVGAVIVAHKHIVSFGYNGFPAAIEDTPEVLNNRDAKYSRTIHAELNAILNSPRPLHGTTLYVWPMLPCSHCALPIIQSGITRVVSTHYIPERWKPSIYEAMIFFTEAAVDVDMKDIVE